MIRKLTEELKNTDFFLYILISIADIAWPLKLQ